MNHVLLVIASGLLYATAVQHRPDIDLNAPLMEESRPPRDDLPAVRVHSPVMTTSDTGSVSECTDGLHLSQYIHPTARRPDAITAIQMASTTPASSATNDVCQPLLYRIANTSVEAVLSRPSTKRHGPTMKHKRRQSAPDYTVCVWPGCTISTPSTDYKYTLDYIDRSLSFGTMTIEQLDKIHALYHRFQYILPRHSATMYEHRNSFWCLLRCFFQHCKGNPDEFNERHRSLSALSFCIARCSVKKPCSKREQPRYRIGQPPVPESDSSIHLTPVHKLRK